jgi:hypothetical protein
MAMLLLEVEVILLMAAQAVTPQALQFRNRARCADLQLWKLFWNRSSTTPQDFSLGRLYETVLRPQRTNTLHCSLLQQPLEASSLPMLSDMSSPPPSKKRKRNQEPETSEINEEGTSPVLPEQAPESAEAGISKVLTSLEKTNIQKKIFHTIKEAGRAFKKARDFEIRKIIKRIKTAKFTLYSL